MKKLVVALLLMLTYIFLSYGSGNCVDFYLLGYSGKGELIKSRLCSVPVEGAYLDASVTGSGLGKSLEVAYRAFQRRHGPLAFGVVLDVEGPYTYIDGRSADIAIYAALYSLINGKKPPLATGTLENDLYSVGGVKFVREKLSAVAGRPVIIPYANRDEVHGEAYVIPVKNLDQLDSVLASLPS